MTFTSPWTIHDLGHFPDDDGNRYEIIAGELYISKQPHIHHQMTVGRTSIALMAWNNTTKFGYVIPAPGIIFADDEAVAPDLVWISHTQFAKAKRSDGKLHAAPELMVEVLSFGGRNEERDRDLKLELYSRRGVREYWILDWVTRQMDVYRRQDGALRHATILYAEDTLTSPLLPGFSCLVGDFFTDIPVE